MIRVVIINGRPHTGKDTVVELTRQEFEPKGFDVVNISAVDCCRDILKILGVKEQKTSEFRGIMCELKDYLQSYEVPIQYILKSFKKLNKEKESILFVHCREPRDIEKLIGHLDTIRRYSGFESGIYTVSLLIKRDTSYVPFAAADNHADMEVENYNYELVINNDGSIDDFKKALSEVLWPLF